ncbi:BaiN/RdsA family NAD(P)/FAD-dependent oxidoreductase [Portibacter marinus]|uniref:NAD(P)/FAD-dependent oxidoreductase n=1 Tax=Portibacter marinus TaxID=2898660 RepID=UPI001F39F5CC|nr:NAD(P)/FAD-dependent oxidoreductase [Portibacter marinus]
MKVAIIGGGAAGFFAALSVKEHHPKAKVQIFEKTSKLLSKVKVSGGGRCNVTNGTTSISELWKAYPRGGRQLKKIFHIFNTKHCFEWFESRGVPLMIQEDQCVFPVSQDSQSIIDCFLTQSNLHKIEIHLKKAVSQIFADDQFRINLQFKKGDTLTFDKVIIATGGSPKLSGLKWLEELGHQIETPVPSLFTFNMPSEKITELMGIVVEKTLTSIQGTALKSDGPLLITHWGMSGPAILKLSAFGARYLSQCNYQFKVQVNWVNERNNDVVRKELESIVEQNAQKNLSNYRPYQLPDRLWQFLLDKLQLSGEKKWNELGKKGMNQLVVLLTNDTYQVSGKTTFKEEFVTCGGVSLESINMKTMESKAVKNLYFAGEVMDIDAITGGYNFQAAWTTAYIAGMLK